MSSNLKETINKHLKIIKDKTGVDPKIILGILGVSLVFTLIGIFDKYITCLVGIALPAFWSMKAIESPESDDDKLWLTYWAVYAVFTFFDLFAGFILKILPFYFVIKLVFLVWCFMPNTKGALFIYNNIIKTFFKKYESKIDKGVNKFMKKAQKATEEGKKLVEENKDKIKEVAQQVGDTLKTQ